MYSGTLLHREAARQHLCKICIEQHHRGLQNILIQQVWIIFRSEQPDSSISPPNIMSSGTYKRIKIFQYPLFKELPIICKVVLYSANVNFRRPPFWVNQFPNVNYRTPSLVKRVISCKLKWKLMWNWNMIFWLIGEKREGQLPNCPIVFFPARK